MTTIHPEPERRSAKVATWSEVPDRTPIGVMVEGIDRHLDAFNLDDLTTFDREMAQVERAPCHPPAERSSIW